VDETVFPPALFGSYIFSFFIMRNVSLQEFFKIDQFYQIYFGKHFWDAFALLTNNIGSTLS